MPPSTARWTRATTASSTWSCAMCPHQVRTSVASSTSCGQPVLGLLERCRADLHALAQEVGQARGDRGVHPLGIERANRFLVAFMDVLAPDGHSYHPPITSTLDSNPSKAVTRTHVSGEP